MPPPPAEASGAAAAAAPVSRTETAALVFNYLRSNGFHATLTLFKEEARPLLAPFKNRVPNGVKALDEICNEYVELTERESRRDAACARNALARKMYDAMEEYVVAMRDDGAAEERAGPSTVAAATPSSEERSATAATLATLATRTPAQPPGGGDRRDRASSLAARTPTAAEKMPPPPARSPGRGREGRGGRKNARAAPRRYAAAAEFAGAGGGPGPGPSAASTSTSFGSPGGGAASSPGGGNGNLGAAFDGAWANGHQRRGGGGGGGGATDHLGSLGDDPTPASDASSLSGQWRSWELPRELCDEKVQAKLAEFIVGHMQAEGVADGGGGGIGIGGTSPRGAAPANAADVALDSVDQFGKIDVDYVMDSLFEDYENNELGRMFAPLLSGAGAGAGGGRRSVSATPSPLAAASKARIEGGKEGAEETAGRDAGAGATTTSGTEGKGADDAAPAPAGTLLRASGKANAAARPPPPAPVTTTTTTSKKRAREGGAAGDEENDGFEDPPEAAASANENANADAAAAAAPAKSGLPPELTGIDLDGFLGTIEY